MKKFLLLSVFAFISVLCSCTKTDPAPTPSTLTISLPSSAPTTAKVGDRIAFAVQVAAPATLSKFEVRKGSTTIDILSTFTASSTTYNFSYVVPAGDGGQTLVFKFLAEDTKGNTKSADYSVAIASSGVITPTGDVRLLSQSATIVVGSAIGSFYVSADNTITNSANAEVSKVDITYGMVGSTPSFVSPDARVANGLSVGDRTGWTRTTFASSSLNFDTVSANELATATTPSNAVQNLVAGGVYIFKNAANKVGLIRVKSFVANGAGQDVVFDIKIVK